MARTAAREHTIGRDTFHFKWDNSLAPAVEIEPGDIVHFDTEEVTAGQLKKGDPASKLGSLNFDRLYPLGGPVYVKGAEPGDALEIEILELKPGSWGWSAILPGLGLLAVDFPEPYVRYFDLGDRNSTEFRHDIHIPLAPFCGTMGVATDEPGPQAVLPPTKGAGNIDTRHLTAGTKLRLPVFVPGALFSAGDCHGAQGDGEVSGTAIECPLQRAQLTIDVRDDLDLRMPVARTPDSWITFGFDEDLDRAAESCLETMLDLMERELALDRTHALGLASVAVDLHVTQVVNLAKGVHAVLRDDALSR